MREQMIYNPGIYQLREDALKRMLDIIYNQKTAQPGQRVFFGDSIIEFYDMNQYFPEKTIYNCGIAGATTDELLWIVDEAVIKYKPAQVLLHVGTNDLGNTVTHSPRQIASNIQMLVSIIQKNLPNCRITILSPLPCDEDIQGYPHARGIRSNAFLKDIYEHFVEYLGDSVNYINAFDSFVNKKELLLEDGLHPNEKGYQLLTHIINDSMIL